MAALYIQLYEEMLQKHESDFLSFSKIHDSYQKDMENPTLKAEFDQIGKLVTDIIQRTQNDLCRKMENTNRGKYSSNLADKFMFLVRQKYPLIDLVGVTVS